MDPVLVLVLAIGAAAALYSSVGHGGASAYIALMALAGVAPEEARPAALVLNILVAGLGAHHVVDFAVADPGRLPADERLRALPGVTDVRHNDQAVSLATSEVHRALPALLDLVREHQADLSLLTTHSATLEDVFVSLTGRHLRDA